MLRPRYSLFYDFHTSPNYPDVGKYFNADQFTDFLLECGVDFLTFHARCNMGMAYYNTKIGIRHPSLDFDLFGELAESCARKKIALNAYFNGGLSEAEAVAHPDWQSLPLKPFSGAVSPMARQMCYNSPYHSHLTAMVEEVVKNYPVSGIFIDCVQPHPCHCELCTADMKAEGLDPLNLKDMTSFSKKALLRMAEEISAVVKKNIDEPLIYFNCIDFEDQKETGTYLECECIPSRGDWGYEYMPVTARYMRTLQKHCLNMTARFYSWGDFGGLRSAAALKQELLFGLANGLYPNIGDHFRPDGSLNGAVLERVKEVFGTLRSHEALFEGAVPFAEAAVVYPKSLDAIRWDRAIRGALKLLSELDIQFDIVTTASDWSKYTLLILPDDVTLDQEVLERCKRHLAAGGRILSTGSAGLTEAKQFPEEWPVEYVEDVKYDPAFFTFADLLPDMPFALHEKGVSFKLKEGVQSFGALHKAHCNMEWQNGYPEFYLPPEKEKTGEFLAVNDKIAHFSHGLFGSYNQYAMSEIRTVLGFALEQIYPDQKVKIRNRPSFLRSVVNAKENSDILHLFAFIPEQKGTATQIIEDEITVTNLEISLAAQGRSVKKIFSTSKEIPFVCVDGRVRFTLDRMQGFEAVTVEYN